MQSDILAKVDTIAAEIIAPAAYEVDKVGAFPQAAVDALGEAGLLGLLSAPAVGGLGGGLREAALAVERVAQDCASTAMVYCMHLCGAAVIEAHGDEDTRRAIAAGRHLSTLAFSEAGSRSHFWAPLSTATRTADGVRLDAKKSFSTSASRATAYVWSSRPVAAEGMSTLWLVPGDTPGVRVHGPFDGLGLRGNDSAPITAEGAIVPESARLGPDGGGFDIMMGIVLPYFNILSAACSVGLADSAVKGACSHVAGARYDHLGSTLSDLPTIRSYLAQARCTVDLARGLLLDTLTAVETGRADTMLRVLQVKATAAEAASESTALAMRVSGGAAFRKDLGIERSFRDAQASTIMGPTTDVLYDFIGKAICGMPLF